MAIPKPVLHTLNIDLIQVSSTNPRLSAYEGEAFDTLVDTIKEHGIITPLTVNNIGKEYFLIAGERRYRASKKAGVDDIPCIVHQNLSVLTDSNAVALLKDIKDGRLKPVCSPYKYGPAIRHTYNYNGEAVCIDENENYGWLRTLSASLRNAEKQVKTNSRADTSAATESFLLSGNTITTET